jgi:beta-N-acetylhexosaminidase
VKISPSLRGLTVASLVIALACAALVAGETARSAETATAVEPHSAVRPAAKPRAVAEAAFKRLTPRERVGQLFMMGVLSTAPSSSDVQALRAGQGGNVFFFGDSSQRRRTVRRVVASLVGDLTHNRVRPFVGVDQEGGLVQRLAGRGFSRIPTALDQGQMSRRDLRRAAHRWGRQLHAAGVNLNLAPVADTVPASVGTKNKPIGSLDREYGHTVRRVRAHVAAFVHGMHNVGVQTAVKHFPGLGRATGNTDVKRRVTDPTRPRGPYLTPYRAGIDAGSQFVMVSSAIYPHIDPGTRACFSSRIIRKLLRRHERFHGIVISDSLSARAVNFLPAPERAIRFLAAGGTMVLDTDADSLPAMVKAVRATMRDDRGFARLIRRDVMRVLTAKARDGLIG